MSSASSRQEQLRAAMKELNQKQAKPNIKAVLQEAKEKRKRAALEEEMLAQQEEAKRKKLITTTNQINPTTIEKKQPEKTQVSTKIDDKNNSHQEEEDDDEKEEEAEKPQKQTQQKKDVEKEQQGEDKKKKANLIPQGFFDDANQDRKIRNVDVSSNPQLMKKEMEKFEKEIESEIVQLDDGVEEDADTLLENDLRREHHLQLSLFARLEALKEKKSKSTTTTTTTAAKVTINPELISEESVNIVDVDQLKNHFKSRKEQKKTQQNLSKKKDDDDDDDLLLFDWKAKNFDDL